MSIAIAAGLVMFWAMNLLVASFTVSEVKQVSVYQRVGALILTLGAFGLLYTAVT